MLQLPWLRARPRRMQRRQYQGRAAVQAVQIMRLQTPQAEPEQAPFIMAELAEARLPASKPAQLRPTAAVAQSQAAAATS